MVTSVAPRLKDVDLTLLDAEACVDRTGWLGGGQNGCELAGRTACVWRRILRHFADLGGSVDAGLVPGRHVFWEFDAESLLMLAGPRLGNGPDTALRDGWRHEARANVDFHVPVGAAIVVRNAYGLDVRYRC